MIIEGNSKNFKEVTKNNLVLVDFFAPWCGPCKMLSPILDEVAKEQQDFSIVKVNVIEEEELAQQYNIFSIPTLIVFKDGEVVATQTGFMPKDALIEWVQKYN